MDALRRLSLLTRDGLAALDLAPAKIEDARHQLFIFFA
jgi:hypothetical protein